MSSSDTLGDAAGSAMLNPGNVNLTDAVGNADLTRQITCILQAGSNDYNGQLGARISALFVILVVSSSATFFPVLATRIRWMRIPLYVYLFARYFGAGVIVATAFIHLLDPAYAEIGPDTCVGMTGGWASYSWPPAIALTSTVLIFLMDFSAERYVETKYGFAHDHTNVEDLVTGEGIEHKSSHRMSHQFFHSGDQREDLDEIINATTDQAQIDEARKDAMDDVEKKAIDNAEDRSFQTQIAAFLILEFGVIFHSVIIGLNLGTAGKEFSTLYPVLVFHQSFEGLGIGARMSAIPFPKRWHWLPWALCSAYGLTTPIAIAIGLGLRTTYNPESFTANVISGVLDSISAGILIYTGLVELLARDFLFDPSRTKDNKRLTFMIISVLLGCALMALLGKWA